MNAINLHGTIHSEDENVEIIQVDVIILGDEAIVERLTYYNTARCSVEYDLCRADEVPIYRFEPSGYRKTDIETFQRLKAEIIKEKILPATSFPVRGYDSKGFAIKTYPVKTTTLKWSDIELESCMVATR